MNVYLSGLLWVVGAGLAGGAIAYLVRRFGRDEGEVGSNEAAGHVFTIVAGLHAVLVAFVLISLFDAVATASAGAHQEADGLVATSWAADALPEPARTQVHDLTTAYANTVVRQEWPQMQAGHQITGPGRAQLDRLRAVVADAPADGDWQVDRKEEAANQLRQVDQARQARLATAGGQGLGIVLWFVLVAGSVITVSLVNVFGGTKLLTHVIIVTTLAGMITLLLFAIYQLQNPFTGGARVGPDAFRAALDRVS
jgi:amino acid transporter